MQVQGGGEGGELRVQGGVGGGEVRVQGGKGGDEVQVQGGGGGGELRVQGGGGEVQVQGGEEGGEVRVQGRGVDEIGTMPEKRHVVVPDQRDVSNMDKPIQNLSAPKRTWGETAAAAGVLTMVREGEAFGEAIENPSKKKRHQGNFGPSIQKSLSRENH